MSQQIRHSEELRGRASWLGTDTTAWFYSYYSESMDEFKKENFEFISELKFINISRGRSAARACFVDMYGSNVEMFSSDFVSLILTIGDVRKVYGRWSFRKQGSNVGLIYLGEVNDTNPS